MPPRRRPSTKIFTTLNPSRQFLHDLNRRPRPVNIYGTKGFVVHVNSALNYDIDLEEENLDEYGAASQTYMYRCVDLVTGEIDDSEETSYSYRCRLRNIHSSCFSKEKNDEIVVMINALLHENNGQVQVNIHEVDKYFRFVIDLFISGIDICEMIKKTREDSRPSRSLRNFYRVDDRSSCQTWRCLEEMRDEKEWSHSSEQNPLQLRLQNTQQISSERIRQNPFQNLSQSTASSSILTSSQDHSQDISFRHSTEISLLDECQDEYQDESSHMKDHLGRDFNEQSLGEDSVQDSSKATFRKTRKKSPSLPTLLPDDEFTEDIIERISSGESNDEVHHLDNDLIFHMNEHDEIFPSETTAVVANNRLFYISSLPRITARRHSEGSIKKKSIYNFDTPEEKNRADRGNWR